MSANILTHQLCFAETHTHGVLDIASNFPHISRRAQADIPVPADGTEAPASTGVTLFWCVVAAAAAAILKVVCFYFYLLTVRAAAPSSQPTTTTTATEPAGCRRRLLPCQQQQVLLLAFQQQQQWQQQQHPQPAWRQALCLLQRLLARTKLQGFLAAVVLLLLHAGQSAAQDDDQVISLRTEITDLKAELIERF